MVKEVIMRNRKSKYTKEYLISYVQKAHSIREVLRLLGYSASSGSMFKFISRKIKEYGIDTSHFNMTHNIKKIPLEDILVENSMYCRTHLKRRLLEIGVIKNECSICGLKGVWNDKPITMRLDHINGSSCDNRIENLRMICPNCDSQLETYCGKRKLN